MPKAKRLHHGDEFGHSGSGSSTAGLDGPIIGAGASIAVDAMVERESGETPPPPPVSVKTLVIGFVVMFVLGLIGLFLLLQYSPVGLYR
jgi:hypothetical protein